MRKFAKQIVLTIAALTLGNATYTTQSIAQADDMHGQFSTTKNGCGAGQKTRIVFTKKTAKGPSQIKGPGFECALTGLKPAGSGMMSSDALCVVDKKSGTAGVEGNIAFDFGNYKDHFEVAIPEMDGWIKMYPCK